jgi:3-hydroxyisobutyrate dehydrogenase-like beta-hydroxyacid dehydrogenase
VDILLFWTCYTEQQGARMSNIGLLHPGEMGISVAASAINSGHKVYWASEGRSNETQARAEMYGLIDAGSLVRLCERCEIILSVCPPQAAENTARSAIEAGFKGLFTDANAISPQRSIRIGQLMERSGARFVDGSIIGGPAWKPKETWLYLAGTHAEEITRCFANGPLEVKVIGNEIGKASALKMCYAAYSKGTTALLAAIMATAEAYGVRGDLYEQWDMDAADFSNQANQRVSRATAKAWRFEDEMREIAATFREAGLPGGFHDAAAKVYNRMKGLRHSDLSVKVDEILATITRGTTQF